MNPVDLWKEPHTRIRHYPISRTLEIEWLDEMNPAEFKRTLEKALTLLKDTESQHWLFNNQKMKPITAADERWMVDDWWPRLAKRQLLKMAIVESTNAGNRLDVSRIMGIVNQNGHMVLKYFHSHLQARAWVLGGGEA